MEFESGLTTSKVSPLTFKASAWLAWLELYAVERSDAAGEKGFIQ
jgi:hypothetical protein